MYKIIGADGRQYGPVPLDQVRQWILQGRANAQTQVQPEGSSEWRSLGSLPEFADVLGSAVPPTAPVATAGAAAAAGSREAACLKIIAVLMLVYLVLDIVTAFLPGGDDRLAGMRFGDPAIEQIIASVSGVVRVFLDILVAGLAAVILVGASRMQSLRSHSFAIVASVLAMLPCTVCCLFGLPVGIWALVVLNRPEVKTHFS